MRVPVYLVCAALVVAVQSEERSNENYIGRILDPAERVSDQEAVRYFLPKLTAKYRQNAEWNSIEQPRYYGYSDMDSNDIDNQELQLSKRTTRILGMRNKRAQDGRTMSIINSLEVLRNKLMRNAMRKNSKVGVNRNRQFLLNVGKRSSQHM